MEKILVVGGAGFIGSHVSDKLTSKGYEVIIYDLIDSPYVKDSQKMIIGGINNENKLKKVLNEDIKYVFNPK